MLGLGSSNRLVGLVNDLDNDSFLDVSTRLLKSMQFKILDSKASASRLDFEATREGDDGQTSYFIRVKRGNKKVTPDELQDAVGKKRDGKDMSPVFISTAGFTEEAGKYADLLNMSGSPTHIKKILMNLVANASEAIEGSGVVTISTTNRYVWTTRMATVLL